MLIEFVIAASKSKVRRAVPEQPAHPMHTIKNEINSAGSRNLIDTSKIRVVRPSTNGII